MSDQDYIRMRQEENQPLPQVGFGELVKLSALALLSLTVAALLAALTAPGPMCLIE